jgi:hypothetical protein
MLSYISVYGRTPAKGDSACQGQAWYTGGILIGDRKGPDQHGDLPITRHRRVRRSLSMQ